MPLPMVHLAVAIRMHELGNCIPDRAFLLGSIAPDAVHMRPGAEPSDKITVHLAEPAELRYERARELLVKSQSDHCGTMRFSSGYIAHLLTDYLWRDNVLEPFHKKLSRKFSFDERRRLYYQETDQIDFDLYYRMPWRMEVWHKLSVSQPEDFCLLLTAEEIGKWRDRVLTWFEVIKPEPKIKPIYITYSETQRFID